MSQLILIRHAQSANNALPEHQRVPDPDLTELGYLQAERAAVALSNEKIHRIYCSPFLRSLQTTRAIAEFHRVDVSVRSDIFEIGGCYSGWSTNKRVGEAGMTSLELAARYPEWLIDERIATTGWWGRPYELIEAARTRAAMVRTWLETDVVHVQGLYILVIHADFERLLIEELLGWVGTEHSQQLGPINNAGFTRLAWKVDEPWKILAFNSTSHLRPHEVT